MLKQALTLASIGFHVFPVAENGKVPAIKEFPNRATRDEVQIRNWFGPHRYNIGILTSKFGDGKALVVVDVDDKRGKKGSHELVRLEIEGFDFPPTVEQCTPSGGKHLIYVVDQPLRQGTDVLAPGLDIRSRGGYIVGPGSEIDGVEYRVTSELSEPAEAPRWLVERLGVDHRDRAPQSEPLAGVDPDRACNRATEYLRFSAEPAIEGQGGDATTFRVLAKVKDYGVTAEEALALALEHWNPTCVPPWSEEELARKVRNVYRYGHERPGNLAPEAVFQQAPAETESVLESEALHPFDQLNREYAAVKIGGYILHETTDHKGRPVMHRMDKAAFTMWLANRRIQIGEKMVPLAKAWLESERRRQYHSVVFAPGTDPGPEHYNLWKGYSFEPAETADHPALDMFLEHARENVCGGDEKLFRWLMGYFAHLVQKPQQKPLTALVFKGAKGTGKNALLDRIGALIDRHYQVADDDRYLLGNFNGHLEGSLLFVLDEAAWAGDKRAEGRLKGLITGSMHTIERKGQEVYQSPNLTRVAIIGNEDWLVPATHDERRFAVFNVGNGRRNDRKFFREMREGMEAGGYRHLLRYLLDYDLTGIDVDAAPETAGLVEQKIAGLDPLYQWWFNCLREGQLLGGDWGSEWPEWCPVNRLKAAFNRWAAGQNIRSRLPDHAQIGKAIAKVAPSYVKKKRAAETQGDTTYSFHNPGIQVLRQDWERWIGGPVEWD